MPGGEFAFRVTEGELNGLAHGVKPAVLLEGSPRADLFLPEPFFRQGDFIVNRELLLKRLEQEAELAHELGWDARKSPEENIEIISGHREATPQQQALTGFVLGYPTSTVRGFFHRAEILAQHVPTPDMLIEAAANPLALQNNGTDQWSPQGLALLKEMKLASEGMKNRLARLPEGDAQRGRVRFELLERAWELFKENLREIYMREYGLTHEQTDYLLERKRIVVSTPQGEMIYNFMAYGAHADQAADIQALRDKVANAFGEEQERLAAK